MKRFFAMWACTLIISILVMPLVSQAYDYFDDAISHDEEGSAVVSDAQDEEEPTDVYHSIRNVILHYVYGDDVSDVPFGTGWADMIASILSCLLLLAPFLLVVMIVRSII